MPYQGDSPVEAWEYWFDQPPSEVVRSSLEQFGKKHDAKAIVEAIAITADKPSITVDANRIKYVGGVLDRMRLRAVSPERAEEEHQIDMLQRFWIKHGHGFPTYRWNGGRRVRVETRNFDKSHRATAATWFRFCTLEEIEAVVRVARSWDDLCEEMERIKTRRHPAERKVYKATFRDVTMVVTEFVTVGNAGFIVGFENANGEAFGETDTTPKTLEHAKTLACRRAVEYVGGEGAEAIIGA